MRSAVRPSQSSGIRQVLPFPARIAAHRIVHGIHSEAGQPPAAKYNSEVMFRTKES